MDKNKIKEIIKNEGDFFIWTNHFECYIKRNGLGAWCGYTVLPSSLPIDLDKEIDINCHGGITYQQKNEKGDLVIGFDCCHSGDYVPEYYEYLNGSDIEATYKDKQFAIDEVNYMVEQVLKIVTIQREVKIDNLLL